MYIYTTYIYMYYIALIFLATALCVTCTNQKFAEQHYCYSCILCIHTCMLYMYVCTCVHLYRYICTCKYKYSVQHILYSLYVDWQPILPVYIGRVLLHS